MTLRRDSCGISAGAETRERFQRLSSLRVRGDAVKRDQHRFDVARDVQLSVINALLVADAAGHWLCGGQTHVM